MAQHRSFHIHVNERDDRPGVFRWSVVRTLWQLGEQRSRTAVLAEGDLTAEQNGGDPLHTALLRLAQVLEEAQRQRQLAQGE